MLKDSRGKIPAFVIRGNTLLHQPTGLRVEIVNKNGDFDSAIREAQTRLKEKIQNAKSK